MTTTPALGVQLYSVRDDLGPKLTDTLQRLAAMGFTYAEPYDILSDTAGLKTALENSGLVASTAHAKITELDRDRVLDAASDLGVGSVIVPWVDPASIATLHGVERLAESINDASAHAAGRGIRVGYHNHDFEFTQEVNGRAVYDVLVELLAPEVVLELDTYWASVGGADVFELIPRLADRVRFLHVKNEPRRDDDRPVRGVDITGRMHEVVESARQWVELPVVEVVVHSGDVFEPLERNAAFFREQVRA